MGPGCIHVSAPAVILSGYLAGITVRGAGPQDVVELQSRVELAAGPMRAHAACTLDVAMPDSEWHSTDMQRDHDVVVTAALAGASITF